MKKLFLTVLLAVSLLGTANAQTKNNNSSSSLSKEQEAVILSYCLTLRQSPEEFPKAVARCFKIISKGYLEGLKESDSE